MNNEELEELLRAWVDAAVSQAVNVSRIADALTEIATTVGDDDDRSSESS